MDNIGWESRISEGSSPPSSNQTKLYSRGGEIPNMPGHCVVADLKTGENPLRVPHRKLCRGSGRRNMRPENNSVHFTARSAREK